MSISAYRHFSIRHHRDGTLMRHYFCRFPLPGAPATSTPSMGGASLETILKTSSSLALSETPRRFGAAVKAVNIPPVAAAAQPHLHPTARTHVHPRRTCIHGLPRHSGQRVLDAIVRGCKTASTPFSTRCRARPADQNCHVHGPTVVPASSATPHHPVRLYLSPQHLRYIRYLKTAPSSAELRGF